MDNSIEQIKNILLEDALKITRLEVENGIGKVVLSALQNRSSIRPLIVNLISDKIGSEQWLYLHIKALLPPHSLVINKTDLLNKRLQTQRGGSIIEFNNVDILYIDDWCLSGCSAAWRFESLLNKESCNDVNYYICTYAMGSKSSQTFDTLRKTYPNVKIELFYAKIIPLFYEALTNRNLTFSSEIIDSFHKKYNSDGPAHLIYSDYKIPGSFGSYPSIYNFPIDRTFMISVCGRWCTFKKTFDIQPFAQRFYKEIS